MIRGAKEARKKETETGIDYLGILQCPISIRDLKGGILLYTHTRGIGLLYYVSVTFGKLIWSRRTFNTEGGAAGDCGA